MFRRASPPILAFQMAPRSPSGLRYAENHGEYKDALDAAAAACVRSGMADVEKAASIYSWLADTIVHTEKCDTAYEALVDKRADCFGFARRVRAIAREAGLECTLVRGKYSSSEHAWNAVKIGKSDDGTGGVWYYVDASRVDGRWFPGAWITVSAVRDKQERLFRRCDKYQCSRVSTRFFAKQCLHAAGHCGRTGSG